MENGFTENEIIAAAMKVGGPINLLNELPRKTWTEPTWTWNQIESAMHRAEYAPEWRTKMRAELRPWRGILIGDTETFTYAEVREALGRLIVQKSGRNEETVPLVGLAHDIAMNIMVNRNATAGRPKTTPVTDDPPIANDDDEVTVGEIRAVMPNLFRHLSLIGTNKLTDQLAHLIDRERIKRESLKKYVNGGIYQAVKGGAVFQRSPIGDGWWGMGTSSHFTDKQVEKLGELKLLT